MLKRYLFSVAIATYLTNFGVVAKTNYKFSYIQGLADQEVAVKFMKDVYNRIGLKIEATGMPGKRAQIEANNGKVDGEIMRIYNYGKQTPNVIRVPTHFYYVSSVAFLKKDRTDIVINKKEDLGNYKLGKVRGVKHTDKLVSELSLKERVAEANFPKQMLEMLNIGRIDVALSNPLEGEIELKNMGATDDIMMHPVVFAKSELYHYIHEKNADLVPKIDAEIKKLKESGELETILRKYEKEVIEELSSVKTQS